MGVVGAWRVMTKLLAVLALSLLLTACNKKEEKVADPPKVETTTPAVATPPAAPAAAGDLPEACAKFKALAEKLGACEKLPDDVRQGVRSSWTMMTKSLKMGGEDAATQNANCTKAHDALKMLEKDCP
jgi:hypothetical protein